jgi:hypothetical protein
VATRDADETPLDGSKHYVIQFPADGLLDSVVDSYWSIILWGSKTRHRLLTGEYGCGSGSRAGSIAGL